MKSLVKKAILRMRLSKLEEYGSDVWIGKNSTILGNVRIGSHVSIGSGAQFVSTLATIYIHDYVVMGPNVTIYTGDHRTDVLGKHIIEITDADKKESARVLDKNVTIESGVWIGTRAIILKGVTIGRGSIIGAGSVVTRDVPAYSVYTGVHNVKIRPRFTEEEITEHEKRLKERHTEPEGFSLGGGINQTDI